MIARAIELHVLRHPHLMLADVATHHAVFRQGFAQLFQQQRRINVFTRVVITLREIMFHRHTVFTPAGDIHGHGQLWQQATHVAV